MDKIYYTDKEVIGLKPCFYRSPADDWSSAVFLRRSFATGCVLVKMSTDKWLKVRRPVGDIRVDGRVLQYIDKFSFTNAKLPF